MKNILFLGSKEIGEQAFEYFLNNLNKKIFSIACVSSNKSKDVWWGTNKIYSKCENLDIDFIPMEKKDFTLMEKKIDQHNIDLIISVQYNWIIPDKILKKVNYMALNFHNAKLPDYKGYNAANMYIMNEEGCYTSTLHWMVERVDSGEIAIEKTFEIPSNTTAFQLYKLALQNGMLVIGDLVDMLNKQLSIPRIKMKDGGNFYQRSSTKNKIITKKDSLESMAKKARAFYFPPFDPSYFVVDGKKYFVVPEQND